MRRTAAPKPASISSKVTGVSSTVSCSRPAMIASPSSCISASSSATATGCVMYGSPERARRRDGRLGDVEGLADARRSRSGR
jgi:hypothetical protein